MGMMGANIDHHADFGRTGRIMAIIISGLFAPAVQERYPRPVSTLGKDCWQGNRHVFPGAETGGRKGPDWAAKADHHGAPNDGLAAASGRNVEGLRQGLPHGARSPRLAGGGGSLGRPVSQGICSDSAISPAALVRAGRRFS